MQTLQSFADQMDRTLEIPFPPKRIVSLVPSQTELLFDLGLDKEVVGITKFCIHPQEKYKANFKVGGTKNLLLDRIRSLKPDLIIGNKEENERGQIQELMAEFPVWMSDIHTLEDCYSMIIGIGMITGKATEAALLTSSIAASLNRLATDRVASERKRVLYLIWRDPYMVAGKNTFIDAMLKAGGWQNAMSEIRYPEISREEITNLAPDVIFLSSEPYPFKEKHLPEFQEIAPKAVVKIVDGELFSWYGSRLRHTAEYLIALQRSVNQ